MIPTHEDLMLPLLRILSDKKLHTLSEIADKLALAYEITEEERKKLLPSGKYPIFRSRVSWAKTYMGKANLLETPKKANYKITKRGVDLLNENPERIDRKTLSRYPEFITFITPSKSKDEQGNGPVESNEFIETTLTPVEAIESAYEKLDDQLRKDIKSEIMNQTPDFFEKLVVDLVVKMGYGGSRKDAGRAIGRSGDEGIDGTINEDKLGLDVIYLQAKRYKNPVPIGHVRDFAGALMGKRARKGIFITTSTLPKSAYEFVSLIEHKIILIDGERLTQLMVEHNVGVSIEQVFEVKRIDTDYFFDE